MLSRYLSDYLCDFDIYLGGAEANSIKENSIENSIKETSIGQKVVLKLAKNYCNTKRCITADNFFKGIKLYVLLCQLQHKDEKVYQVFSIIFSTDNFELI